MHQPARHNNRKNRRHHLLGKTQNGGEKGMPPPLSLCVPASSAEHFLPRKQEFTTAALQQIAVIQPHTAPQTCLRNRESLPLKMTYQ